MGEFLAFIVFVSLVVAFVWCGKRPDRGKRSAPEDSEESFAKTLGGETSCLPVNSQASTAEFGAERRLHRMNNKGLAKPSEPRRFLGLLIGAWIALALHGIAVWGMLAEPARQRGQCLTRLFIPSAKISCAAFFELIGSNFLALAALALGVTVWCLSKRKFGKVTIALSLVAIIIASALC